MQVSEIQKKTGLSKQTLFYYEKEGLIHPEREENGYRNYTDQDLQTLILIRFLRSLEISIDDIQLFLNGKLSFDQCLETNKIYISDQLNNLKIINDCIDSFQQKNLPIIPKLAEVKSYQRKKGLGYVKSTDTVSIGCVLTRSLAIRKWLSSWLPTFMILYILLIILWAQNISKTSILLILCPISLIIHAFIMGHNFSFLTFYTHDTVDKTMNQSVEFLRDGISYYEFKNWWAHVKFTYAVIFHKKEKLFRKYTYEDIEKVVIKTQKRKSMYGIQFVYNENWSVDYELYFKDHQKFIFRYPFTLENDSQYIAIILKEKVPHIIDEHHALDIMAKGLSLDDYFDTEE